MVIYDLVSPQGEGQAATPSCPLKLPPLAIRRAVMTQNATLSLDRCVYETLYGIRIADLVCHVVQYATCFGKAADNTGEVDSCCRQLGQQHDWELETQGAVTAALESAMTLAAKFLCHTLPGVKKSCVVSAWRNVFLFAIGVPNNLALSRTIGAITHCDMSLPAAQFLGSAFFSCVSECPAYLMKHLVDGSPEQVRNLFCSMLLMCISQQFQAVGDSWGTEMDYLDGIPRVEGVAWVDRKHPLVLYSDCRLDRKSVV